MEGINLQEVVAFIDDLIIFSNSLEEHEERVMKVLKRIAEFGLKLSPSKCKFFQTSVKYLGHVISAQGIQPDPDKITAVKDWPCPQTAKELRSFLGFTGYYRRFVRDYSCIVRPLNDLLKGELAPRHKGQKHWPRTKSPSLGAKWTPACQAAFGLIVEKLISAPVLVFANWQLLYVLHTDASMSGLGAALYQVQDGQTRVVAYASRGLSKSEKNYPVHKLEFLALKWAVSEKFHDYLYGTNFKVLTDNMMLQVTDGLLLCRFTTLTYTTNLANITLTLTGSLGGFMDPQTRTRSPWRQTEKSPACWNVLACPLRSLKFSMGRQ